jgi:hypothetical protein
MDAFNFPIFNISHPSLPITPQDQIPGAVANVSHVNFITSLSQSIIGAGAQTKVRPCVSYFEQNYPKWDSVYGNPSGSLSPLDGMDSMYLPQPKGGWFNTTVQMSLARYFAQFQLNSWYLVALSDKVNASIIGNRGIRTLLNPFQLTVTKPFPSASNGILGTIEGRYYVYTSPQENGFYAVPWYNMTGATSKNQLDEQLGQLIGSLITDIAKLNKTILFNPTPSDTELASYFQNVSAVINKMPYGGIFGFINSWNRHYF